MSPDGVIPLEVALSFPRVSGDEPAEASLDSCDHLFSPRERG